MRTITADTKKNRAIPVTDVTKCLDRKCPRYGSRLSRIAPQEAPPPAEAGRSQRTKSGYPGRAIKAANVGRLYNRNTFATNATAAAIPYPCACRPKASWRSPVSATSGEPEIGRAHV